MSIAAEQLGQPAAVERPARARAAADARDAVQQREVHAAQPLGVPQQREGVRQQEVPDRRRLRRLQVRVVGREVVGMLGGVTAQRRGRVEQRVVQVDRAVARHEAQRHAERLAARAPAPTASPPRRGRCAARAPPRAS